MSAPKLGQGGMADPGTGMYQIDNVRFVPEGKGKTSGPFAQKCENSGTKHDKCSVTAVFGAPTQVYVDDVLAGCVRTVVLKIRCTDKDGNETCKKNVVTSVSCDGNSVGGSGCGGTFSLSTYEEGKKPPNPPTFENAKTLYLYGAC